MELFEFQMPTKVVFGSNTIHKVGEELAKLGGSKVLVIIDPIVHKSGSVGAIFNNLEQKRIPYGIFNQVEPEPSIESVEAAFSELKSGGFDIILAVGGGSCLDTAKAVGVLATNLGNIQDYAGWNKFNNKPIPLIAIPTTAGTGSEMTDAAVITNKKQNVKFTIKHDIYNRPSVAILDPCVLRTVPKGLAVTTGFDALAHAVEAYTSLMSTPYLDAFSLYSIELIGKHLHNFALDRSDEEAASGMLLASNMAGIAFPIAGTGNCHCIGRFLGGTHPISHGMCCSIILPHVVEFNYAYSIEKFKKIAMALGADVHGLSSKEAAYQAVVAIKKLALDVGLPSTVREFNSELNIDSEYIADECSKSWYNKFNPRFTTKEDFIQLIKKIAS
ncbi:MAG: hypothetical protein JM58_17625 [Peptococcaceae bacterium BICA1-8]|nr:MAG: hypothetical protein JM58_17625 [Peptococcaceae bacterium BICA1-8]